MLLPLLLAAASPADAPIETQDRAALERVSRDLCFRQVAVLGEATHADGHSEAFKVALVERLVTRCGYRAVVFEGSMYEFAAFDRARRAGAASEAMLGDAIGGLWKFETEVKPLIGFLYREAVAGRVTVAGMDDQIGGFEQPFANRGVAELLAAGLPEARRVECVKAFDDRVHWLGGASYPDADRLLACLAEMRAVAAGAERLTMLDGLEQAAARDALPPLARKNARDAAMFGHFRQIAAGLPRGTKIIVWTHNVHAARDPAINGAEDVAPTFGTLLGRTYGRHAFALGVTARGGSYRVSRREVALPEVPEGALERAVQPGGDTIYLDAAALRAAGAVPAGFNNHAYRSARWAEVFDGAVVFAEERAPHSTRVYPAP